MAEMDMGFSPKRSGNHKKNKKKQGFWESIVTGLFPVKGDSTGEILRKIVFLTALIVLVVALVMIAVYFVQFGKLEQNVADGTATDKAIVELKNTQPTKEHIDNLPQGTVNEEFAALYAENSDFIGWLNIPGTNIDYPVVQTDNNDFYLHRDFHKEYLFAGTLFADYEGPVTADGMPQNTVIYGHNMMYKYQFSGLMNYKHRIDFLKYSPVINFDTLYGNNSYKIISVFVTNVYKEHGEVFEYNKHLYFKNRDEFFDFVLECEDRSIYEMGVDVEYGDEFLTLSTCDQDISLDLRLVIVARKVRPNESPEVDTSKIVKKSSTKYFDAYYDIFGKLWKGRTWDTSVVKGMDEYIKSHGLEDDPKNY